MSKIYAVDFDGTLCENKWPEIGEPHLPLIRFLISRRAAGDKIMRYNHYCQKTSVPHSTCNSKDNINNITFCC